MAPTLVIAAAFAYLGLLFALAHWADRRGRQGRPVIDSAWVYALSMAVYCTAWTYFGSVGRAASTGLWFLPIYLGPTLAMVLGWVVLRKMVRIAHTHRITTIADFIGSRYGKSPVLAGLVTVITVVGIVPYIALQLKGIAVAYAVVVDGSVSSAADTPWWRESTFYLALGLAVFTIVFGVRHWDSTERKEAEQRRLAEEQEKRLQAQREERLKRLMTEAGSGTATSGVREGGAAGSPSPGYAAKLRARIRPNIVYTDVASGNPQAEVEVRAAPDGTILSSRLLRPSGNAEWDQAVLRAIDKTQTLPRDENGKVPSPIVITFRPRDL